MDANKSPHDGSGQPNAAAPPPSISSALNRLEAEHQQLRNSLGHAGKQLLLEQFCRELDRLLAEQATIIPLLGSSRDWAQRTLTRHYFAIRSAANIMRLGQLAEIAGRAEVLLGLLGTGKVKYSDLHQELLRETGELLGAVVQRIRSDGSDHSCVMVSQTARCLFAAVAPATLAYSPAADANQPTAGS